MKPRNFCLLLFSLFVIAPAAIAQPATGQQWTLGDCIHYATQNNIQVATLRLANESTAQDLIYAKAQRLPRLSASVGNNFVSGKNRPTANSGLVSQLTSSGTYSVNSSLVVWNGNAINNTIRQSELRLQAAELSVEQSANNITLLVTQRFLEVMLAKENLKYVTDLVQTSQAMVRKGQIFYDAGSIAKKELLQLQAQLASDSFLLVQSQNAIRQSILGLQQTLQLSPDSPFDIAEPVTITPAEQLAPLLEVRAAALRSFPDLKIARLNSNIASIDIEKARAGFKPTLSASAQLASGYSDVLINAKNKKTGYFTQTWNNFYQQAGLSLSIPIFSNRQHQTELAKAKIAYEAARLDYDNTQLVLSQAVEQAYLDADNAIHSFRAAKVQLDAVTENYRIAKEQFNLGAIDIFYFTQQRNQYIDAMETFIQAKYAAALQQKIVEFYLGHPLTL